MPVKLIQNFVDLLMNYVSHFRILKSFTSRLPFQAVTSTSSFSFTPSSLKNPHKHHSHHLKNNMSFSWISSLLPNVLAPSTPVTLFQTQNFDYFLILDFEATCDSPKQMYPMEIIEFPVLKVNGKTFEVESTFHRYVRPTINPVLSTFCTGLTGIIQDMVDESDKFHKVMNDFKQWMVDQELVDDKQMPIQKFTFATCGDWDLKKMFLVQCHLCGHDVPGYMRKWINVKKSFVDQLKSWPKSQASMLEYLGIEPTGRAHSGIDDCHNLATVMRELAKLGHVYQNTSHSKNNDPTFR